MPYRMIYSSKACQPMGAAELEVILDDARQGNEARNVTGALIYTDGVFLQVLEGETEALMALVRSIRRDTRHEAMKVFHASDIEQRAFDDWRMAYLDASTQEMSRWAGLAGTVTIDQLLERVHEDASRIPKILVHIVEAIASESGAAGHD